MKRVITSFGAFCTGDAVADAMSRYALALARAHDTDLVEIPYLDDDDVARRLELRVGWLVEIGIVPEAGHGDELLDHDTVERLDELTRSVRRSHVGDDDVSASWSSWDFEL